MRRKLQLSKIELVPLSELFLRTYICSSTKLIYIYRYPAFGEAIGWLLALASMVWIPGVAIYKYIRSEGSLTERLKKLTSPDAAILKRVIEQSEHDEINGNTKF